MYSDSQVYLKQKGVFMDDLPHVSIHCVKKKKKKKLAPFSLLSPLPTITGLLQTSSQEPCIISF